MEVCFLLNPYTPWRATTTKDLRSSNDRLSVPPRCFYIYALVKQSSGNFVPLLFVVQLGAKPFEPFLPKSSYNRIMSNIQFG